MFTFEVEDEKKSEKTLDIQKILVNIEICKIES